MDEVTVIDKRFYILATSPLVDDEIYVLKSGDMFGVFNRYGDIEMVGLGESGIYYKDTRFLSLMKLRFDEFIPLFLSSNIKTDNSLFTIDLTNPDLTYNGIFIPKGTIHVSRSKFLHQNTCYEKIELLNYGNSTVAIPLLFQFGADFKDIFEVRGAERKTRGDHLPPSIHSDYIEFGYKGADGMHRTTRIQFSEKPQHLGESEAKFRVSLRPREGKHITITTTCTIDKQYSVISYEKAVSEMKRNTELLSANECTIFTSNEQFNDWINRSMADIKTMLTKTEHGLFPYAGIPWFSTVFGRDGIITALETMWMNPGIGLGVLKYLAHEQAKTFSDESDAEPGKILHEARWGEMANTGDVPFKRYYGTIDATPLFLVLAKQYWDRTKDRITIEEIWPNLLLALEWIDKYGDKDGDGFVEYISRSERGLVQQGWKDSFDSVFHKDGKLAPPPIALCEVQAYVYAAKTGMSELAAEMNELSLSRKLKEEAYKLKTSFERDFWSEAINMYALALDGNKKRCEVKTSNAAQCLFSGIASYEHALKIVKTVTDEEFFSGWGIRTVSKDEKRYNPMSYHNGSIWPHDNALIAYGMSLYGFKEEVLKVMTGLFNASIFFEFHRLPELFCGFKRRTSEAPTHYPVACPIQSWAAASVFMLIQSALGLKIDAINNRILFDKPQLPEYLEWMEIRNLRVNESFVDMHLQRSDMDVAISVTRRKGNVEVIVVK